MPTNCPVTWDANSWLEKFRVKGADYHSLRREVWENTLKIVEDGGYTLPNGDSITVENHERRSKFYHKPFNVFFEQQKKPPEITVTSEDCLDAAYKWIESGLKVSVLNMASRRNPGGGVRNGAGAQEEYLFRCSDYYKFLYRYAPYAEEYNLTRSHYQYPLDKNFGGIFSEGVTIFRENEESGYKLAEKTWKVNIIAVAGMNSPRLVFENGEDRIAPELVEGVKNKIRTIFRIALDNGQKNLILGALGCGAFHNPPKHVAELFSEVLCEQEFFGAFQRICFAVKTSHTSKGDTNFLSFKKILDGFIPTLKNYPNTNFENPIKKIVIARDSYAILKINGEVEIVNIRNGESSYSQNLSGSIDIAAGFHHMLGLDKNGNVTFEVVGSQDPQFRNFYCPNAISVYACEYVSAVLKNDGKAICMNRTDNSYYKPTVESWQNIKQLALTFEEPFALTRYGKFFSKREDINDFFNDCGKEIVQIDTFGAYYTNHVVATLYIDGTVNACEIFEDNYRIIEEVKNWKDVKKICCGNYGTVFGLTNSGKVLLPQDFPYKDRNGNDVKSLENILDIEAAFDHFIALNKKGNIIYLHDR